MRGRFRRGRYSGGHDCNDTSAAPQISRQQPLRGRKLGRMPTLVSVWSQHRVVVCVGFGSLAVVVRLRAVGCSKRAGRAWSSNLVVPTEALRPPFQMQPRMQAWDRPGMPAVLDRAYFQVDVSIAAVHQHEERIAISLMIHSMVSMAGLEREVGPRREEQPANSHRQECSWDPMDHCDSPLQRLAVVAGARQIENRQRGRLVHRDDAIWRMVCEHQCAATRAILVPHHASAQIKKLIGWKRRSSRNARAARL